MAHLTSLAVFWIQLLTLFLPTEPFLTLKKSFTFTKLFISSSDDIQTDNPNANPDAVSHAGIPHVSVLSALNGYYKPQELGERNALSRSDGYWPFIKEGKEPPPNLTYGEFDFYFFAELLDRAYGVGGGWEGKEFVDIGSGAGRLVLGAAALYLWRLCRGIEVLQGLHDLAVDTMNQCKNDSGGYSLKVTQDDASIRELPLSPMEFICASVDDPSISLRDVDLAFVASSCMPEEVMTMIGHMVHRQCKPGAIVITTDYTLKLEDEEGVQRLELVETMDGYCWVVGGVSTAYVYRVVG